MTGAVSARCWQGERVTSSPTVITQSRRAGRHRRVQRQVHVRTVRVERTVASGLIRDSDHMNWPSHQPLRTAKEHLHEDCSFWCLRRGKAFCRASGRSRTRGEGCLSFEQITSGQPSSAGEANFYDVDALTNLIDEFDAVEHQACRISPWLDVQEPSSRTKFVVLPMRNHPFPHSGTPQVALFPLLGSGSDLPFDHDPSSALRAGDAGAKNAVRHGQIIGARISSSPKRG